MNKLHFYSLLKNHHTGNLLRIFFLLGFLIAGIRLETFIYSSVDNYSYSENVNNELVTYESPKADLILTDFNGYDNYNVSITSTVYEPCISHSFKIAVYSYNRLIISKLKTLRSACFLSSNIITILQKNNISHKSPEEGPVVSG